jgi:hypothetical protein
LYCSGKPLGGCLWFKTPDVAHESDLVASLPRCEAIEAFALRDNEGTIGRPFADWTRPPPLFAGLLEVETEQLDGVS